MEHLNMKLASLFWWCVVFPWAWHGPTLRGAALRISADETFDTRTLTTQLNAEIIVFGDDIDERKEKCTFRVCSAHEYGVQ